jgi:hypothetical protein
MIVQNPSLYEASAIGFGIYKGELCFSRQGEHRKTVPFLPEKRFCNS